LAAAAAIRRRRRADAGGVASGQFRLAGVAPGDYRMFAWEDVPTNAWQDEEFMRKYENRGTAVHIEEGGSEQCQVTTIPIGQ
jgi:hypothetical protein